MTYTVTIYSLTDSLRFYTGLSLEQAINYAKKAVSVGRDFDIKETK